MYEPKCVFFDKQELQTPPYIFNWLDSIYIFDIDICASDENHFCDRYFKKERSALDHDWWNLVNETGFCNPPYNNIDPFITKAVWEAKNGFTSAFLIPDFNGEKRFTAISEHAANIIHLIGRVSHIRPDNGEPYKGNNRGSVIVEFSKKYWPTPPIHQYVQTKDLIEKYG